MVQHELIFSGIDIKKLTPPPVDDMDKPRTEEVDYEGDEDAPYVFLEQHR